MRLYNSIGPNPRAVRIFMAEKGLDIPFVPVDLMGGENRRDEHVARNPAGQLPTLELDDGTFISEITAICEYLDEIGGGASLIGSTPEERAETRMWTRRIDLNIVEPLANGFRYSEGLGLFKDRIRTIPHAADDLKALAQEKLAWLDELMEGKEFVCGDRFSLADVLLFAFVEFGGAVGQPLDPKNARIQAWFERVAARPSVTATA